MSAKRKEATEHKIYLLMLLHGPPEVHEIFLYKSSRKGYSVFARLYNIIHVETSKGDAINESKNEISSSGVYSNCEEINSFLTVIMFGITYHEGYNWIPILDSFVSKLLK